MSLCDASEYMGDSGQELISDYFAAAETTVHEDLKMKNMSIYVCREPDGAGILIEEIPILTNLGNLAKACCLGWHMHLILSIHPRFPKHLRCFKDFSWDLTHCAQNQAPSSWLWKTSSLPRHSDMTVTLHLWTAVFFVCSTSLYTGHNVEFFRMF